MNDGQMIEYCLIEGNLRIFSFMGLPSVIFSGI